MEDLDVVVVGAGLSGWAPGINWNRLSEPGYAIAEARDDLGRTWDPFPLPRSVRLRHAPLGFGRRPGSAGTHHRAGGDILEYIAPPSSAIDSHIRYRSPGRAGQLGYSADEAMDRDGQGTGWRPLTRISCRFLPPVYGSTTTTTTVIAPTSPDRTFAGLIVHPQQWPANLDVADQRIIVIGSGGDHCHAAAALVDRGAQVTMLQRSPTYIASLPSRTPAWSRLAR